MTEEETKALAGTIPLDLPFYLSVALFSSNYEDRTLLYGYDVNRVTWHLFVAGGEVHLHRYSDKDSVLRVNFLHARFPRSSIEALIIPNKRLYPEACDYEFCRWAKQSGMMLPFTTFDATRPRSDYYGRT